MMIHKRGGPGCFCSLGQQKDGRGGLRWDNWQKLSCLKQQHCPPTFNHLSSHTRSPTEWDKYHSPPFTDRKWMLSTYPQLHSKAVTELGPGIATSNSPDLGPLLIISVS